MLIEINTQLDEVVIPLGGTLVRNMPDPIAVRRGETRVWTFRRNDGAVVCDVTHDGDIKRLLAIREGFAPHGDEARTEARDSYGWREDLPTVEATQTIAAGQPSVVLEMVDDDLDDIAGNDDDDDNDDLGLKAAVSEDGVRPLGDLPVPPPKDADGDLWMAYGAALVSNPKEHAQLEEYARANYGVDLDKRWGTLRLLKEIASLQVREAA